MGQAVELPHDVAHPKCRLHPTKAQRRALEAITEQQRVPRASARV